MSRLRIVNLGLPKSGTTSLGKALKLSGWRVADYRIRPRQTTDTALHDRFVADLIYDGYFHSGDPLALMEQFDGFAEISVLRRDGSLWPQTDWGVIAAIMEQHPGAKFLATRRDPFEMSQSMLKWNDMGLERVPELGIPGLPAGYGATTRERIQWIEAHYAHLRRLFTGSDRFLEVDVADPDAPERIGAFLGRPLKWWGRINTSDRMGA